MKQTLHINGMHCKSCELLLKNRLNDLPWCTVQSISHTTATCEIEYNQNSLSEVEDIINNGIIMSGGSAMLRHLPDRVERRTGVKAVLADDAFYCVAKGTGIALEHLDTYKRSIFAKR